MHRRSTLAEGTLCRHMNRVCGEIGEGNEIYATADPHGESSCIA